jgi:hypothetical protein
MSITLYTPVDQIRTFVVPQIIATTSPTSVAQNGDRPGYNVQSTVEEETAINKSVHTLGYNRAHQE